MTPAQRYRFYRNGVRVCRTCAYPPEAHASPWSEEDAGCVRFVEAGLASLRAKNLAALRLQRRPK